MERLSVDERARSTAAYDAMLLDLFDEISAADAASVPSLALTPAAARDDAPFVDFQADLDAFDAMIESAQRSELLLDAGAAPQVKHESAVYGDAGAVITTGICAQDHGTSGNNKAKHAAAAAPVKKSAPGGNNARKRQREELRALRESAVLLEKELVALKTKARESPPPASVSSGGGLYGSDTLSPDQKVPRRWPTQLPELKGGARVPVPAPASQQQQPKSEAFLAKNRHTRQITELENIHLSKLVNDHVKVTQKFEKALEKQRSQATSESLLETLPTAARAFGGRFHDSMSAKSLPRTPGDAVAFEALEKNVETRYHELERVFQAVGLADCRTDLREARIDTNREEGGVMLQFKSSRVIPFSAHVVNETALRIARSHHGNEHIHEKPGTTVAFKKELQVGGMTIKMRGVSKRFTENGRIVIIWDGVSEWPSDVSGEFVDIEQKGWGIIQPYPQPQKSSRTSSIDKEKTKKPKKSMSLSSSPMCLMQSYICMSPGVSEDGAERKSPQPEHIAILSDVVMPIYTEVFDARIQHLENVLLDDSFKRRLIAS